MEHAAAVKATVLVPPTRRPNARSIRSKAPWVDLYGFRPLLYPFLHLSPFEFVRHFAGAALGPPTLQELRTEWTPEGERLSKAGAFWDGHKKIVPGLHYVVREPQADDNYFTFPAEPHAIYKLLRHSWVLVRKSRPHVPALEGAPLPAASKGAEYNAKYMSVFFRPWTLHSGTHEVPHLRSLGALQPTGGKVGTGRDEATYSFAKTWDAYIRGNIASEAAARYIRSMLMKTIVAHTNDDDEASDPDASDIDDDIPALVLAADDLRVLLRCTHDAELPEASDPAKRTRKRKKGGHIDALRNVDCMWGTGSHAGAAPAQRLEGPMHESSVREHLTARGQRE